MSDKRICNFVFLLGLEVATKHSLPTQLHTGFGDKDLDLLLANPLHLRDVLEDARFAKSVIVLLHTSHPYSKEASYLAHVYQQVYLDWGLVFHMLSSRSIQDTTHDLFSMTPLSKVGTTPPLTALTPVPVLVPVLVGHFWSSFISSLSQ